MLKDNTDFVNGDISQTMTEYLAEIYRIGRSKMWVSTTTVAERLDVSGPATVRMVGRLQQRGLVEHLPYKGVQLTELGEKVALLSIRRHRLVESFLVNVLKFGWHEAHFKADVLQKGINQELEDRIDALLGHLTRCPHGNPIPTREGKMPYICDRPLTVIPAGTSAKITRVRTRAGEKLLYLGEIGLVPDAEFELISRAPFNGPLRLKIGRNEQIIGTELAAALWVECETP